MKGIFRYGKGVAASLLLATLGVVGRYGPAWVFPHVDPLPGPSVTYINIPRAAPPVRQSGASSTTWKLAVVTNRPDKKVAKPEGTQTTKSLKEQVADAIYETAQTHYGFCDVSVPTQRRRGDCPVQTNDVNTVSILNSTNVDAATFYAQLNELNHLSHSHEVLVFVHGFNVSQHNAIARAAQIAEDMPFDGLVVVFSWQSRGRALAYRQDEILAERHFWSLAELLHGLRKELPQSQRIHMLAHSMGNRVTLRAINALAGTIDPVGQPTDMFVSVRLKTAENISSVFPTSKVSRSHVIPSNHETPVRFPIWASWRKKDITTPPLTNLILAAPDVNAGEFRRYVSETRHIAQTITVYTSDTDLALEASQRIHSDGYRAGDSRTHIDIPGVQFVRVSAPSVADLLGHSYYGSHPQVLDQLHRLTHNVELSHGMPIGYGN